VRNGIWWMVEDFCRPVDWSLPARRAFVCTLPISGPLWLAGLTFIMGCCALSMIVLYPILLVGSLWTGKDMFH
jgi:hypothetical protein